MEKSEKAGSHRESNPGHLWLVQHVQARGVQGSTACPDSPVTAGLFTFLYITS